MLCGQNWEIRANWENNVMCYPSGLVNTLCIGQLCKGICGKLFLKLFNLVQKRMIFCIFYIFFSESHILWNIVANIKKKNYTSEIDKIFIYRKKQVCCVIIWLCRSIFIAKKMWLIFVWLPFTLWIVKDLVKRTIWF